MKTHSNARYFAFCLSLCLSLVLQAESAIGQMIVAHRGASAAAPENTLAAFELAWEQGADAVEGDFYLTADRKIVCIHDATTKRVSDVDLKVADTAFSELRKLDVGSWKGKQFANERIPTLEEVLATIPAGKKIFVEIKCGPEIVPRLKTALQKSDLEPEQVIVISFNKEVVRWSKDILPDIQAYWLVGFPRKDQKDKWQPTAEALIETAKELDADGFDLQAAPKENRKSLLNVVTPDFVKRCHKLSLSLHAWTVDDPEVAKRLFQHGFSSVTTNRPGLLRKSLDQSRIRKPATNGRKSEKAETVPSAVVPSTVPQVVPSSSAGIQ